MSEDIHELKEKIRILEDALGQHDASYNLAFALPNKLGRILALLMSTPYVDGDTIEARLSIATPAKLAIMRLRRKLKPYGVEVKSQYALGYYLTPESKEKVRKRIAAFQAEAPVEELPQVVEGQPTAG